MPPKISWRRQPLRCSYLQLHSPYVSGAPRMWTTNNQPIRDPPYRKMGCKISMIWGLLAVDGAFSWSQRTCSFKMCEIHEKSYKRKMCQTLPPPKKTLNLTLSEAIFPIFSIGGCGDSFKPVTTGVRPWLPVNWSATSIDV